MASSECVKVALRCRPLNSTEIKDGYQEIVFIDTSKGEVYLKDPDAPNEKPRLFTFDFSFDKTTSQKLIFEKSAKEIVEFVIKGYNGTIFAYGQTGTGKTHTMQGGTSESEHGITPRSFKRIFDIIKTSEKTQYLVSASMYELYNEQVNDLLNLEGKNLKIKESPDKGFYIQDLQSKMVKNEHELMEIMDLGSKNRKTSSTAMNDRSSRSHCIFVVNVDSQTTTDIGAVCYTAGKLNLVDLAGSEKQKKTDIKSAEQKKEAIQINLSLTTLRKCISELIKGGQDHISFRESKLTMLLKDSLGGNTKTFMIANIGPASYNHEESLSTLKYAYGAKSIKNKPKINEDPKDTMIRKYNDEIEQLKLQLAAMASGNSADIDPKALMLLLGGGANGSDDKMGQLIEKRQEEIEKHRQELDRKKQEIDVLRQQRLKSGENAEKVERELMVMESEISKQEVAIDEENLHKARLLDQLGELQERLVVGDKEKEKVEAKKKELESYKSAIQGDIEAYQALEQVLKENEAQKDKLDKKYKEFQTQISQYDKEINQRNMELTRINAEIKDFEEIAAADKEKLFKENAFLTTELHKYERIVNALVPHSVEQILTALVEWNEKTQNWEMVKSQKIQPRYERPISIHGLKKPTLAEPGCRSEYQNCFLKAQNKSELEFWKDLQPDEEAIIKGDVYLESQMMQMNPEELEVNEIDTVELDKLEKEILEKELREAEEARKKVLIDEDGDKSKLESSKTTNATSRSAAGKPAEGKKQAEAELFPEARGKKFKRA
jgi:hypothetical protein